MTSPKDWTARRAAFARLHERGCFVLPNPWDVGTARYLRHLGFRALATTSSGFAFSRGLPDGEAGATRDLALQHVAEIVAASELPVNADFQAGYADEPEGVADGVRLCIETGTAGLSIEDATGNDRRPLHGLSEAVERIRAARRAIDASSAQVLLTGRAECFLVGDPNPLKESIRRLQAYAEAGADVLYAPGPRRPEDIAAIVKAVAPKPVNVLLTSSSELRVADLAELGVRRVSVGSELARAAWGGFLRAARKLTAEGTFAGLEGWEAYADLNAFFRDDIRARSS